MELPKTPEDEETCANAIEELFRSNGPDGADALHKLKIMISEGADNTFLLRAFAKTFANVPTAERENVHAILVAAINSLRRKYLGVPMRNRGSDISGRDRQ